MVTLGFGFKSYVSYKMRLRKQKEVQKENEFYMQLLQQALPPEQQMLQRQEREAEEGKTDTKNVKLTDARSPSPLKNLCSAALEQQLTVTTTIGLYFSSVPLQMDFAMSPRYFL